MWSEKLPGSMSSWKCQCFYIRRQDDSLEVGVVSMSYCTAVAATFTSTGYDFLYSIIICALHSQFGKFYILDKTKAFWELFSTNHSNQTPSCFTKPYCHCCCHFHSTCYLWAASHLCILIGHLRSLSRVTYYMWLCVVVVRCRPALSAECVIQ